MPVSSFNDPTDASSSIITASANRQIDAITSTTISSFLQGSSPQHTVLSREEAVEGWTVTPPYSVMGSSVSKTTEHENKGHFRNDATAEGSYTQAAPLDATRMKSSGVGDCQIHTSGYSDIILAADYELKQHQKVRNSRSQGKRIIQNTRKPCPLKARRKVPQQMQAQWRIGAAPSLALTLTREESEVTKVLSQATAFHCSMNEVFWAPSARIDPFLFDLDNRVEVFRDSSVTATCLVAAGKMESAQKTLDKVLPTVDGLLRKPPPSFYLILAELSLGLVRTPYDDLRVQIIENLARRAHELLGPEHPITALLRLRLPASRKIVLGDRLWKSVLPILAQTFGPDHYQLLSLVFCQARNLASSGHFEEAVQIIEMLIDRWGHVYGGNSLIICYAKIELANILIVAGLDIKAELVVSDALRISDMIQAAELKNEDCPATEKRHRESSIAFPRVAGLRTLGRINTIRGNLGAATHCYSQAVAIGSPLLGEENAAVELAQKDFDSARSAELQKSMQRVSLEDLPKLANIVASPIC